MRIAAPRRALVTGGTGYIGRNLTRRLVAEGWQVTLLVRDGSDLAGIDQRVVIRRYDDDFLSLARIVRDAEPLVVFHLASLFLAQHTPTQIRPLIESNILLGTQLLEALAVQPASRLVFAGSYWQHYQNASYNPVNLYAATKQAFEAILKYYLETTPLRAIGLHLFDIYGPGDPRQKLFNFLRSAAHSQQQVDMSTGEQLIDLVYIDDVVSAFLVAAERLLSAEEAAGNIFAVSCGQPIPLREVVRLYAEVTGQALHVNWGGRPSRPREMMVPWSSGPLLPGWAPSVSLTEGIRLMTCAQPDLAPA